MMDLPDPADVSSESSRARADWLDECAEADLLVLGGGVAAVTAGLAAREAGFSSVIVETGRTPEERFFSSSGPVMILSPADETLAELGCDPQGDPPLWRDLCALEVALLDRFFDEGGRLVRRAVIDGRPQRRDHRFETRVNLRPDRRVFTSREVIVTVPLLDPEPAPARGEHVLHRMLLATRRREDHIVQAGHAAAGGRRIPDGVPAENGLILSGRKAAEIVLNS